ncbi:hypothetical protein [Glycomyces tenuis]|uniref:hypothetical protein n=1 Tax=Glycomyces tenuis TaxID=58116 RepID=UPI000421182D|nr:hypothetical protein [Glycomyces tenuis]
MSPTSTDQGGPDPWELVTALKRWAEDTDWVDWAELAGSLGRGAGDELSDVDAGIGVHELAESDARIAEAAAAVASFAPVAATLHQRLNGSVDHLICAYRDGRQLSLVVVDETARPGLPPQAAVLVDKSGRLSSAMDRSRWDADEATVREWAFLAWIAIGDAARHRLRDRPWRALKALDEARDNLWKLWAHTLGLVFPVHGAVAVENADAALPSGIEETHPRDLSPAELHRALAAVGRLLEPYTTGDLSALAETVGRRLALLG